MLKNVPKGLYRNDLGAELNVVRTAMSRSLPARLSTLGGDIAIAEAYDDLFGTTDIYLVTEASLKDRGYELVTPADL